MFNQFAFVTIMGHKVPAETADQFIDGLTGEYITDADWDESKRRMTGGDHAES